MTLLDHDVLHLHRLRLLLSFRHLARFLYRWHSNTIALQLLPFTAVGICQCALESRRVSIIDSVRCGSVWTDTVGDNIGKRK